VDVLVVVVEGLWSLLLLLLLLLLLVLPAVPPFEVGYAWWDPVPPPPSALPAPPFPSGDGDDDDDFPFAPFPFGLPLLPPFSSGDTRPSGYTPTLSYTSVVPGDGAAAAGEEEEDDDDDDGAACLVFMPCGSFGEGIFIPFAKRELWKEEVSRGGKEQKRRRRRKRFMETIVA